MPGEEATIEPIEGSNEDTTETTDSLPSQIQYICSVCGKLVVPKVIQTARGVRHQCPECKKFMKPLTPEEVEQRQAMEIKIAPLEIEMTTRVKELLKIHLPKVYGIPAKAASARIQAIIDTLSPPIATNPFNLHNHIKRYAATADDKHLETIINTVFAQLEIEGYKPGLQQARFVPNYGSGFQPRTGLPYYQSPGGYPSYQPTYPTAYPQNTPPGQKPPQQVKVIVDGQEISTDLQGSMAWKKYMAEEKLARAEEEERAEQKRQRQETHDLEKQKFQAEIKAIAEGKSGSQNNDALVEVMVGEQKLSVPASIAPFYLMNQRKEDPQVTELKTSLNRTNEEIKALRDEANKKQIDNLQGSINTLAQKLDKQPTFQEQLTAFDELARARGLSPAGKTTLDVLSEIGKNVDGRAEQMLKRMPSTDEIFKPDVRRTTEERAKKAEELSNRLEKKEDVLSAEDALIKSASQMG